MKNLIPTLANKQGYSEQEIRTIDREIRYERSRRKEYMFELTMWLIVGAMTLGPVLFLMGLMINQEVIKPLLNLL